MSSVAASKNRADIDEALLYLATAIALASSLLAAGWGSGSLQVGMVACALGAAGVWTSWSTRRWTPGRRGLIGALGAVLAAGALQALVSWETGVEVGALYQATGDIGLSLALRMSVLLVALSFLLISQEMVPFALVPGLTLLGLTGGRGNDRVAFGGFLVFLPAALAAVGQGMLLSGARESVRGWGVERGSSWRARRLSVDARWRRRHWSLLGVLMAGIVCVGSLIYVPVLRYGTQYYWPLAMMSFGGVGGLRMGQGRGAAAANPRSYPVGQGPTAPTGTPLLSVAGEPASLWRGEVFDSFSGSAWASSDQQPTAVRVRNGEISLEQFLAEGTTRPASTREMRVEQDMPFVIYSAGQVEQAQIPRRLQTMVMRTVFVDKFGCVSVPGAMMPAGARYKVTSRGVDETRGDIPGSADDAYVRIPLSSRRVADLARRLTADARTTEEKVQALVSYLQRECVYTLEAPAVPRGEDAADYFVFTSKRGYCDLFATAFAIMARAAGIPARFVTGFSGGQYDPETHRYVLRESDRHAWVELYAPVEGGRRAGVAQRDAGPVAMGWVAVDATPGAGPVTLSAVQQAVAAVQTFFRSRVLAGLGLGLAALLALLAVALAVVRRRVGRAQLALDRNDPRTVVVRAYARLTRALARRGYPRRMNQTPLEYVEQMERGGLDVERGTWRSSRRVIPGVLTATRALTDLFVLARYSSRAISRETAGLALNHLAEATEALRGR